MVTSERSAMIVTNGVALSPIAVDTALKAMQAHQGFDPAVAVT
jgi:hypothetical protein